LAAIVSLYIGGKNKGGSKVKKIWLAVIGVVVLIVGVVGLVGCNSEGTVTLGNLSNQQTGIWTSGEGKVYATPDVAILTLGIESQEASVVEARDKAVVAMEAVTAALKAQGIADEDIQTQYFNIYQVTRWDSNKETEVVTGYRVTHTVTVKVREIEKAGDVIDAVVAAGGDLTRINNINLTIEDPQPYYEQAREKAFDYANAKAQQLAEKAGVKLGKVTYITESSGSSGIIYRNYAVYEDAVAVPAPTVATNISTGELEITATVNVAYEID
jgi:uncharacterized protein YggE